MDYFINMVPILCLSYLGHKALQVIHFPASRIVGPILTIAAAQLLGLSWVIPYGLKVIFSIVFGVYLGLRFNAGAIHRLKNYLLPATLLSFLYVIITLLYGELLTQVSPLDSTTAFLSVIPGGVAESGVLAVAYGADLAAVSSFQLTRFLSIVIIVPLLAKWFVKPTIKKQVPLSGKDPSPLPKAQPTLSFYWLFIIGAVFSGLFYLIRFPAALLLGATFGVALFQLVVKKPFARPPQQIYGAAQIGMGAVIGTSFTAESLSAVSGLGTSLLLLTALTLGTSILLAFIFSRLFKWDFMTCYMSVLPGGLSTMIILAEDFDADIIIISSLQLIRLLTAVMIIPMLYQWLL